MAAEETRKSFPTLSAGIWWTLRKQFRKSLPTRVEVTYLETVLGVGEKAAKNTLPQLRALGLLDDEGRPTDLANEWRSDDGYKSAARQILENSYPQGLKDAVPPEHPDRQAAQRWFMREGHVGEASAKMMAALYTLLAEGDHTTGEGRETRGRGSRGSSEASSQRRSRSRSDAGKGTRQPTAKTASTPHQETPPQADPQLQERASANPALHIDVQIHIPSDATADQIDTIFSSMAKHIYGRRS